MYSLIVSGGDRFAGYVIAQCARRRRQGGHRRGHAPHARLHRAAARGVPVDEQLGLLPFKIGDLASFKTVRTLTPRASVLLTDGTEDTTLDGARPTW